MPTHRHPSRIGHGALCWGLAALGLGAGCAQVLGIEEIEPWSGAAASAPIGGNNPGGGPSGGAGAGGGELPAGCSDDTQNGTETDVDCGGQECPRCANGQHCDGYADCQSQFCDDGVELGLCVACGGDDDCAAAGDAYCASGTCEPKAEPGEPCAEPNECASGYCVDDVCCATACDGGCDSCDVTGREGICTIASDGDGGDGTCAPYLCDGEQALCPTSCSGPEDCLPDPDAYCGDDKICHGTKPLGDACQNGSECASDYCVDEVCCESESCGTATDCNVCNRPSSLGSCATAADNASCDDGLYCNGWDRCVGGACNDHAGNPCVGPDGDADCSESCSELTADCSGADQDGAGCSDGAYCNGADSCSGGSCGVHTGDPCAANIGDADGDCSESCNDSTDSCTANDPNGSSCNDSLYCTVTDRCNSSGSCVGTGSPCPGADGDSDCSETCNESADDCSGNDANGSSCNDSAYCNGTDTCTNGSCTTHSGDPCLANVGDNDSDCSESCNETADACTANDPANSVCNDGQYCTVTDRCNSLGTCVGTGDPCPGPDADSDCSETCNETTNNCTANDPDDSICPGGCCYGGTCVGGCA